MARRVLDLGCGRCELADYLALAYEQEVTGVDISDEKFPKRRTKPRGAGKRKCVKTDAGRLGFLENSPIPRERKYSSLPYAVSFRLLS